MVVFWFWASTIEHRAPIHCCNRVGIEIAIEIEVRAFLLFDWFLVDLAALSAKSHFFASNQNLDVLLR